MPTRGRLQFAHTRTHARAVSGQFCSRQRSVVRGRTLLLMWSWSDKSFDGLGATRGVNFKERTPVVGTHGSGEVTGLARTSAYTSLVHHHANWARRLVLQYRSNLALVIGLTNTLCMGMPFAKIQYSTTTPLISPHLRLPQVQPRLYQYSSPSITVQFFLIHFGAIRVWRPMLHLIYSYE
jgi:hypothetical protein